MDLRGGIRYSSSRKKSCYWTGAEPSEVKYGGMPKNDNHVTISKMKELL